MRYISLSALSVTSTETLVRSASISLHTALEKSERCQDRSVDYNDRPKCLMTAPTPSACKPFTYADAISPDRNGSSEKDSEACRRHDRSARLPKGYITNEKQKSYLPFHFQDASRYYTSVQGASSRPLLWPLAPTSHPVVRLDQHRTSLRPLYRMACSSRASFEDGKSRGRHSVIHDQFIAIGASRVRDLQGHPST